MSQPVLPGTYRTYDTFSIDLAEASDDGKSLGLTGTQTVSVVGLYHYGSYPTGRPNESGCRVAAQFYVNPSPLYDSATARGAFLYQVDSSLTPQQGVTDFFGLSALSPGTQAQQVELRLDPTGGHSADLSVKREVFDWVTLNLSAAAGSQATAAWRSLQRYPATWEQLTQLAGATALPPLPDLSVATQTLSLNSVWDGIDLGPLVLSTKVVVSLGALAISGGEVLAWSTTFQTEPGQFVIPPPNNS